MNQQNKEYWAKRYELLKDEAMQGAEMTVEELSANFDRALRRLTVEIENWYKRYATENGITLEEARKQLNKRELADFKMTLEEYIEQAKREDLSKEHQRMLENASIRARLDRTQALYISVVHEIERLSKAEDDSLSQLLRETYETTTYKTAHLTQTVLGEYNIVPKVSKDVVDVVIKKPWAPDGKDFSSRIWDDRTKLVQTIQNDFVQSVLAGDGMAKMTESLATRMKVSQSNARRLVETETARIYEEAFTNNMNDIGVEKLEILATLDRKTSKICKRMDGKIVPLKDAKPGVTIPPFHCHCRTTTIPYFDDLEIKGETRASRGEGGKGKSEQVDGVLTYHEWYNKYVKSSDTNALIGVTTSNGIKITDISDHQQERADDRKLNVAGIKEALENPLFVRDIVFDNKGRPSQRFVGNEVTVNINPDTGVIVTSWKTGTKVREKYQKEK